MAAIIAFLTGGWSFISGAGKAVGAFFSSLPRWLQVGIVAALALALWTWWAIDHGKGLQRAADEAELTRRQSRIEILAGDVEALQAAINDRNRQIDEQAAEERKRKAAADVAARGALGDVARSRRHEAARAAGPDAMNSFMIETFGK